jgi:mono/diheme cytochrome c family protein
MARADEAEASRRRIAVLVGGLLLGGGCQSALAQQDPSGAAITPAMIALGDSVFHGRAGGGACFVCHGQDGKGTPGLAPNLTAGAWLHGDGSYEFLVQLIQQGVAEPKEGPAPMPPMGGAQLSPEQVRAVAAYVYSISRKKPKGF